MKLINLKNEELLIDKDSIEPLIIIYDLEKEPKNKIKIKIKDNINASIVEVFNGLSVIGDYSREIIVGENSNLEYLKYQDLGLDSIVDFNYDINIKKDAVLNLFNIELGFGSTKNLYNTNLDNENSQYLVNGLVKIKNESDIKSTFKTVHNNENCLSNITYKHILDDKTKAIFEAKSIVNEKALNSKVFQNSQTLLLSEDAVIFAQPHLEINIDELEASHGATTGSLDEEQIFYLMQRGISKQVAKNMLLKAVENKIYDKIIDKNIKEFIQNNTRS